MGRALRTRQYKYVVYAPEANPWTQSGSDVYREKYLFDLGAGPAGEEQPYCGSLYAEVKAGLRKRLFGAGVKGRGTVYSSVKNGYGCFRYGIYRGRVMPFLFAIFDIRFSDDFIRKKYFTYDKQMFTI